MKQACIGDVITFGDVISFRIGIVKASPEQDFYSEPAFAGFLPRECSSHALPTLTASPTQSPKRILQGHDFFAQWQQVEDMVLQQEKSPFGSTSEMEALLVRDEPRS